MPRCFQRRSARTRAGYEYAYTTFGYTCLGGDRRRFGHVLFEYLRERILKPAGMLHTQVDDIYAIIPNRARGYSPRVYGQFNGDWRNPA